MSDVVADSSVVAKWVIPEPDSAQAHRLYSEVVASGGRLIVLDIALVEVANALWKRQHRGLAMSSETDRLLDDLLTLSVHVEPALTRLRRAVQIAQTFDLAVYDALFIALAEELGLPGVTADEPLRRKVNPALPQIVLLRDWPPPPPTAPPPAPRTS